MSARLRDLWGRLTGSLWFVPGLIILGAILLAVVMVDVSARVDREALARLPRLFGAGVDGSRSLLATIAGSIITVAGVTFSITVVAVAQASSQYTPRVLRNFMRDRPNQIVLGGLAGIFVYCLVVLRTIRGGEELDFIPAIAVLMSVVLAVVGIGLFVFFIHHIAETLEAGSILTRISRETTDAVDRLFPDQLGEELPDASAHGQAALDHGEWQVVPAMSTGYIQRVDEQGLLDFARQRRCILRMERGIGEFVFDGLPLVSLTGARASDDESAAVNTLFTVSSYRTVDQDAAFGIRQIVDIALKALSPGINDTTTAVSSVDHLGGVLAHLAPRRVAEPYRTVDGALRVVALGPSFESLLKEALDEIRQHAAGNASVLVRLLGVLEQLVPRTTSARRRALLGWHADLIRKTAARSIGLEEDRADIEQGYGRVQRALGEWREAGSSGVRATSRQP